MEKNSTIKEILLNIDAKINHIEDMTADNRKVIIKLVKQSNLTIELLCFTNLISTFLLSAVISSI
jgi:hypothetical protein